MLQQTRNLARIMDRRRGGRPGDDIHAQLNGPLWLFLIVAGALGLLTVVTWSAAADLDPAIQADLHLVQTEEYIKQKNYGAAQDAMAKIFALQKKHDMTIPVEFHFKYAQVLELAAQYEEAASEVTHYLEMTGRTGTHYREALTLLHKVSVAARLEELHAAVGTPFRDCDVCPEMTVVPAGNFMMGSPDVEDGRDDDEGPLHSVVIAWPFAVGIYEVTFEEWDACVESGGCGGHRPDDEGWGRGRRPVVNVSWDEADQFVAWLRERTNLPYRLLSEAEWEYASRAGTKTARYWVGGSEIQCWYGNGADATARKYHSEWTVADCDDGYYRTAPVGSYKTNVYGLHDVLGNVWEWVKDCWNDSYREAPSDGSAWESGDCGRRVLRGGAWGSKPGILRSANRFWNDSWDRDYLVGFRVARAIDR